MVDLLADGVDALARSAAGPSTRSAHTVRGSSMPAPSPSHNLREGVRGCVVVTTAAVITAVGLSLFIDDDGGL